MPDASRLPRSVVPIRYDLELVPDLAAGRFEGQVTVHLDVLEPAPEVALHALGIDVDLVVVTQNGQPSGAELVAEPTAERVVIRPASPFEPGPATAALRFRGALTDGLVGLYRSRYRDADGNEQLLAATQFEAPHARRAFPCFDEPEFKAVFSISLVVDDGLVALSNSEEVGRETLADGRVRVRFGDTIPMSTYLVAAIVGPLEVSAPVDAGGIPVRVAHVPGKGHLTSYALEVGAFALRYFTDYYGIPYPGEKLDLVALPDFAFGAMENLGCVTFRETLLLVDRDTITQTEATNAALTIVHEIAHMWFGDLVTMKWWNGIWLNEAFATFMEHAGVDAFRSEWKAWDDFALGRAAAMEIDALSTTRPVEYEVHSPEDADGMFDLLTYEKGGSVVRMLEQWTGPDAFRSGVRHYLDRYQFANTETHDLWDALEAATGRPARRIMDSWIFQPGLPEVSATRDGGEVRLRQRRFTYANGNGNGNGAQHWSIPLLVRVGDRTETVLLDDAETTIAAPADAVVVVHGGGEGFYRVNYPASWRAQLVESGVCNALERFALVDDAWAQVVAGDVPASDFLDLCLRFAAETDLIVWRGIVARLRDISNLVDGDALAQLRTIVGDLVRPAFDRLGWEPGTGEDSRRRQLRGLLVDALGTLVHDEETIRRARDAHADPEVASAALVIVADTGSAAEYEQYLAQTREAPTPQEQIRYLYALPRFPSEELLVRTCALTLTDQIRTQSAPFVVQRALKHRTHGRSAWEYMRDNWDAMLARFPRTLIPRIFDGVTWLVDDASVAEIPAFVAEHPVAEGKRTVAQHLERQQVHAALARREHNFLVRR